MSLKTNLALLFGTGIAAMAAPQLDVSLDLGYQLAFSTEAGASYQIERTPAGESSWQDYGSPFVGDGSRRMIYSPGEGAQWDFRVEATSTKVLPPESPLANGGFEDGAGHSFDGWTTTGSGQVTRETSDVLAGAAALSVNIQTTATEVTVTQVIEAESAGLLPGETYDLSFWTKEIGSAAGFVQQYRVKWLDSAGNDVSSTGFVSFSSDSVDWAEFRVSGLVAPAEFNSVEIRLRFVTGAGAGSFGEILFDNISFFEGGSDNLNTEEIVATQLVAPGPVARVRWQTAFGMPYWVYTSTDLLTWTELDSTIVGDGGMHEMLIPLSESQRFFRVEFPDGSGGEDTAAIISLFDAASPLEAPVLFETEDALITRLGDRARDRHARESQFQAYDHYLSWYWEERTIDIEIEDRIAKGGSEVVFTYRVLSELSQPEFRAFFRGIGTVAEYYYNTLAPLVAPNTHQVTLRNDIPSGRPLAIGDRIEVEISQFILAPQNGRKNYYGTTFLYIVGQGVVPWQGVGDLLDSYPLPESAWMGGRTTLPYQYSDEPDHRFQQTAGNISPDSIQDFMLGRRLHHTDFGDGSHSEPGNPVFFTHANKLGPKYNAHSCIDCHVNNGRSISPGVGIPLTQAVIKVASDITGTPHPTLGRVLQAGNAFGVGEGAAQIASFEVIEGTYGDGGPYQLRRPVHSFSGDTPEFYSVRYAPPLVGMGLLEAVDESTILARADPEDQDGDGISGRANTVIDPQTGEVRLGRFNWKASQARVRHQVSFALNNDMGVMTSIFPTQDGSGSASSTELSTDEVEQITRYVQTLGVSARRELGDIEVIQGQNLFNGIGCAECHVPTTVTGAHHPIAELRRQVIHPYTDLLVHDMGSGLADTMGEGNVSPYEWRTPPLWSIGLTDGVSGGESYLHDGRARTLEEAILWHGGEGGQAKENFRTLPAGDRDALIKFLKSL